MAIQLIESTKSYLEFKSMVENNTVGLYGISDKNGVASFSIKILSEQKEDGILPEPLDIPIAIIKTSDFHTLGLDLETGRPILGSLGSEPVDFHISTLTNTKTNLMIMKVLEAAFAHAMIQLCQEIEMTESSTRLLYKYL